MDIFGGLCRSHVDMIVVGEYGHHGTFATNINFISKHEILSQ